LEQPSRKIETTILVVIVAGFVAWSAAFIYKSSFIAIDGKRYFCLIDDAMISMRYAWNFSHGLGLVWNAGERIQGYTNLLMTLLMSLATLLFDKSSAVLVIQVLGALFMLAIAFLSRQIAGYFVEGEAYQRQAVIKILTFFCALAYYPLAYWSLMGMETGLLTVCLLGAVLAALAFTHSRKSFLLLVMSVTLGLAYLTRNDSILFAILIWAYVIWDGFDAISLRKSIWRILPFVGLYAVFVVGQTLFQYLYYGDFLPNTYTLKMTGMPFFVRIGNGVGFVAIFLVEAAVVLIPATAELLFDFGKKKLLLFSIMFTALAYQIYVGGDPWDYWRMLSPAMPLVFILFILAANALVNAAVDTEFFHNYFLRNPFLSKRYLNELLVAVLVLAGLHVINTRFLPEIYFFEKPYQTDFNQKNVNTAIAIDQFTTRDATIGVYWAGTLPYFIDRRAIDFLGKSDRYIAHLAPDLSGVISSHGMTSVPGHNKYDLNYSIKKLLPVYVQGFHYATQDLSAWAKTRYVDIEYRGISLSFLKDSPAVLWEKIAHAKH